MVMLEQRIQQQFFDTADLQYQSAQALSRPIADAAQALIGCITAGGKLLVGGSGGGAALAQYFCATLVHRFERERPGLAALALAGGGVMASVALDDGSTASVLARQVLALGQPGDVLLLLDAAGAAEVTPAVDAAHTRDMSVVVLCGAAAAAWQERLNETDVRVSVPHERTARVLELQLLVLHCLCDAVDLQLMGEQESQ